MIKTELYSSGLLSQLGEEVIGSYDTGPDGSPVADIVEDLFGFQRKSTKITVGTISVTGTRAVQVEERTILSVLLELRDSVGGYITVDNDRVFDWATDIGEDKGQQIRYRKNLVGIERNINYDSLCTKLHVSGSVNKLSDIIIGPATPGITTDASYAYFTLLEQYAAYLDWTGEGEALPDNIKVWRENTSPSWVQGTGESGVGWSDPAYASDGNTGTYAEYLAIPLGGASTPLHADFAENTYNRCKYYVWLSGSTGRMKIQTYNAVDGWTTIFEGSPGADNTWHEFGFTNRTITEIKVIFYNDVSLSKDITLNEIQLQQSDLVDVTADWVQGAWENIIRADIGDYDEAETYTIEYTHANYLMAWDKITDGDDLVSRVLSVPAETYSLSLIEYGRLLLDETKIAEVSYLIDTVNLVEVDSRLSFEALQLGSIVTMIDEDLGIDVSARVVKITFPDLLTPENMLVEVSSRIRDISDVIATMSKLI